MTKTFPMHFHCNTQRKSHSKQRTWFFLVSHWKEYKCVQNHQTMFFFWRSTTSNPYPNLDLFLTSKKFATILRINQSLHFYSSITRENRNSTIKKPTKAKKKIKSFQQSRIWRLFKTVCDVYDLNLLRICR